MPEDSPVDVLAIHVVALLVLANGTPGDGYGWNCRAKSSHADGSTRAESNH